MWSRHEPADIEPNQRAYHMKYQEKNWVPKTFVAIPNEENDVEEEKHHFNTGNKVEHLAHTIQDGFKLIADVQEFYSLLELQPSWKLFLRQARFYVFSFLWQEFLVIEFINSSFESCFNQHWFGLFFLLLLDDFALCFCIRNSFLCGNTNSVVWGEFFVPVLLVL